MMKTLHIVLFSLVAAGLAQAQTASIQAPEQAPIGGKIELSWTGPGKDYDSIYLVPAGAPDKARGIHSTAILSKKNPLRLTMAEEPGDYELRYGHEKQIIARRPIKVVDVPASLDAPASGGIGEKVKINWEGPGNDYDWIGLFETGAPENAKSASHAAILSRRNPLQLRLPEKAGQYELRYKTSRTKRTLATRPITVQGVGASIDAPASAPLGSTIKLTWEGPGNDYDWIGLYQKGAPANAKITHKAAIVSKRNPLLLRLPEEPGEYELRYRTVKTEQTLATRPLTVTGMTAALEAPARATAATDISVKWEGPGNDYDQIALFPVDAPKHAKPLRIAGIVSGKNPVQMNLPDVEGPHELRYRTAQSDRVLVTRPITIEPAGRLLVILGGMSEGKTNDGSGAVEVILDASGSMLQRENGTRRIEIARSVLSELVREHLSDDHHFALRVFGHKEADQCQTDLEIPLGKLNRTSATGRIKTLNPKNRAKTPIADSLAQVPSDLAGAKGLKTVILITDGEETCDGNPAAVIQDLRGQGLDLQVSIVGFAIDDAALKRDFQSWADLGGGGYFDARSADELSQSLRTVISGPFRVLDPAGKVVGRGIIGGAEIVLPAGTYRIETVSRSPLVKEDVQIKPKELTKAVF